MLKGYYRHEKTGEMQTPPLFLTCHYKFNQSNISLKKRRGYSFFLNCLRTLPFKESLKSAQMWLHHNVHRLANTIQFPAPLHMLLVVVETQFALPRMERKSTHNLDLRQ
jgi:hypothetical protein